MSTFIESNMMLYKSAYTHSDVVPYFYYEVANNSEEETAKQDVEKYLRCSKTHQ